MIAEQKPFRAHAFEYACARYFYESHDQLRSHLRDFVSAYNFARRLKTLKGLTPYEFICRAWTSEPQRFKLNPLPAPANAGTKHSASPALS
jgi:transposase InsO family protein